MDQIAAWRKQHRKWGPKTLRAELGLVESFQGKRFPARSSIARWIQATDQARLYEKHSELPTQKAATVQACHEEWEMDARGYERLAEIGIITLIDINDVFSRVHLLSHPCWLGKARIQRFPSTEDYQQALRLAFSQWGLPDRLATDHDRVFYQRKVFLNEHLPCATFGERPPLDAHPEARVPRRPYRPEWEAELLDLECVYAYLAQGQWFRKVSAVGTISIGRKIYHLGYDWRPDRYVELVFEPKECRFICQATSGKVKHLPVDWLTKEHLMGEFAPICQLPAFQIALPFSWNEWRALTYIQAPPTLDGDTTF